MNVSCPDCVSIFRVDPAKVPEAGIRARCSVCGAVMAIGKHGLISDDYAMAAPDSRRVAQPAPTRPAPTPPHAVPNIPLSALSGAPATAAPVTAQQTAPSTPAAAPVATAPISPPPVRAVTPARPAAPAQPAAPADWRGTATPAKAAPSIQPREPVDSAPSTTSAHTFGSTAPAQSITSAPVPASPAYTQPSRAGSGPSPRAATPPSTPTPPQTGPLTAGIAAVAARATAPPVVRRPINPFLTSDPNQKAKRLARALVSDIVAYFPDKRKDGLQNGTLKGLFREEIKRSYEEYVDQVGREFAESTSHFRDALNEILAGGSQIF